MSMPMVIVESPYKGHGWWPLSVFRRWRNVRYARACVYVDLGMSDGMRLGIESAHAAGRPVEMRRLEGW